MLEGRDPSLTLPLEGTQDPPGCLPATEQGTTPRVPPRTVQYLSWEEAGDVFTSALQTSRKDALHGGLHRPWEDPPSGSWGAQMSSAGPHLPGLHMSLSTSGQESFNRFTLASQAAGDSSSAPVLSPLTAEGSLGNW